VLFDPADPNGLAAAVSRLCSDHALRTRVAANAQRTISDMQLTWGANARKVTGLFGALRSHA
jgi:glycosyltransferase involved in cell wall biosynthesis